MSHLRVAVLRGGPSEEYAVSMKTGSVVLSALTELGYNVKDVVITRGGDWLDAGLVRVPENILQAVDVVFIALHGSYGEDGEVQKILQRMHIPFTGSRAFPSSIAFNKRLTKEALKDKGVKMAGDRLVSIDDLEAIDEIANEIVNSFGSEYIIKPVSSGSSYGVNLVKNPDLLSSALAEALTRHDRILVEEYIRGREATSAVLEGFRNESIYVFPTVEIIPPRNSPFFNTESKYDGRSQEICPARFSYKERNEIAEISAKVHEVLDLAQYSRSDFIIADDGVYFLEVNTLPGLTPESLYPKAASSVGLDVKRLIQHLIENATC
jgi:D-alanine-D-alanine ligase